MKKCRPADVGISLEKPGLKTPESQQVQIRPPEAAAISRAHIAAPSDVSDTPADKAEGSLATSQAKIAAGTREALVKEEWKILSPEQEAELAPFKGVDQKEYVWRKVTMWGANKRALQDALVRKDA